MTTKPKLSELSTEQKRVLCAEVCGWMKHPSVKGFWRTPKTVANNIRLLGHVEGPWDRETPPDYPNDLNAMHEAENTLTPDEQRAFGMELQAMCVDRMRNEGCRKQADFDAKPQWIWHATASQRLDAFLLAKGLAEL